MFDLLIFVGTILLYLFFAKKSQGSLESVTKEVSVPKDAVKLDPTKIILLERHSEGYFAYRFMDYGFLGYSQKLDVLLESLWNKNPTLQIVVEDNPSLEQEMLNAMNSLASQTEPYPSQVQK